MTPEKQQEVQDTYSNFKVDKAIVRKNFSDIYDMDDTLDILRKMYSFLKERHFDLPKLQKRTIEKFPKGEKRSNSAYCDYMKKQIRFKPTVLKKRVDVTEFLDDGVWKIYKGNYMLFELLTHEMAHFRVKGMHNKRFYIRQKQLFSTAINGIISGQYYNNL